MMTTSFLRPNLFSFATSELSQDAFLCWLASWAQPGLDVIDKPLHETARAFIARLFGVCGLLPPACKNIQVKRQYQDIDLLLLIDSTHAVIIEDKTNTSDPISKLKRYQEIAKADFPQHTIASVYLKTRDQSNYNNAQQAGYGCFLRGDLLKLLSSGEAAGCTNQIFTDFLEQLRKIEAAVQSYRTTPISHWSESFERSCWKGFFMALQQRLGAGRWSYVPNPSGGFMGFDWAWKQNRYLQLENEKLCFKIEVKDPAKQSSERDKAYRNLMARVLHGGTGIQVKKPGRFGTGDWMTIAVVHPYLQTDANGLLDFDATVAVLKKAEALV